MELILTSLALFISIWILAAIVKIARSNENNINKNNLVWYLILIFLVINILDIHSTLLGIRRYGLIVEGNPIVRYFLKEFGVAGAIILNKVPNILFLIYISLKTRPVPTEIPFCIASLLDKIAL